MEESWNAQTCLSQQWDNLLESNLTLSGKPTVVCMYVCMNFKCFSCIVCLFRFARSYQFLSFYFPKDFSMFAYYVYKTSLLGLIDWWWHDREERIDTQLCILFICIYYYINLLQLHYTMYVHISLIERTKLHKIKKHGKSLHSTFTCFFIQCSFPFV